MGDARQFLGTLTALFALMGLLSLTEIAVPLFACKKEKGRTATNLLRIA